MKLIKIKDREHWLSLRLQDITSTETAALFGVNPYTTEFELWHRKKNQEIVTIEENERMTWGNRLESAIAEGIAEDQGWTVAPLKDYGRDPELRAGSSFDFCILNEEGERTGLLEIKNVDGLVFRDKWVVEDGEVVEAPLHIEIQCQHQLMMSGLPVVYIGALVGGNSVRLIERRPQPHVIEKIKLNIKRFWDSVDNDQPPKPDFEKDAAFLSSLYDYAEPDKLIESEEERVAELVDEYKAGADLEKKGKSRKSAAKAEILTFIKDAEKVKGRGFSISAGVVGPAEIEAYTKKGFRSFRVYKKKEKE